MSQTAAVERTKWPFMFVVDADGHGTDWVVLHAPIQTASRKALFGDYRRRDVRFVGMTSFMAYPSYDDRDPLDYTAVCEGWCHCFSHPVERLPDHTPHTRLALSDFTDVAQVSSVRSRRQFADTPGFDFVYVGDDRPWKMVAKNWPLAHACLPELCDRQRLRGLIIGVPPALVPAHPRITAWPWLPRPQFLEVLAHSRCLLVPNVMDASPRVLAEALCLDVPVVVNRELIGGQRYVTPQTGVFFSGLEDVAAATARALAGGFRPRAWFSAHSGPRWASRRLVHLLQRIDPAFDAPQPLGLSSTRRVVAQLPR